MQQTFCRYLVSTRTSLIARPDRLGPTAKNRPVAASITRDHVNISTVMVPRHG